MVLPLLAIGMLAIVGVVGLSVDVGHVFLNKTRLQNALDSAALSGARTLMLTSDAEAAGRDARYAFGTHLDGGMPGLASEDLVLQYSDTLVPFVAGGDEPSYVRVALERFAMNLSFVGVLPDVGESTSVGGTAVAGPAPLGYPGAGETCDVAPIMVCGTADDRECSDGSCFGYEVGSRTEYELRLRSAATAPPLESERMASAERLAVVRCGERSAYDDCVPVPERTEEPGNFILHELDCGGEDCVREALAGAFDACPVEGERVGVEPADAAESLVQGLMTRFGVEHPSLARADYPQDVVFVGRDDDVGYRYGEYRRDVAAVIAAGSSGSGVPYRRVLTVPVSSCGESVSGGDTGTVLGFLCLFLTREIDADVLDGTIYGQFVNRCEASGERGASVPPLSGNYHGPLEIVLYQDPLGYGS